MPRRDWNSRFDMKKSFILAFILLGVAFNMTLWKLVESLCEWHTIKVFVFMLMLIAVIFMVFWTIKYWEFYNSED